MSQMLEAALAYAKLGLPVFPCNEVKEPLTARGCLDATTDPALIAKMWHGQANANIGMHVGAANMMVVDLDIGHDINEVHRAFEGLPVTLLKSRTPSGGEHLFYALVEGETVSPSASKIAPHVDIRSWHSYVLLPPSRTIDSSRSTAGVYEWAHEADNWPVPMPKPAHRTDVMVKLAGKPRARTAGQEDILPPGYSIDTKINATRYSLWLQKLANPGISGKTGNNMLSAAGAMGASYGLSQEKTIELLIADFNPRCDEAWTPEEIAKTGGSGYRTHTSAFGNMADPDFQDATKGEPGAAAATSAVFRRVSEFANVAPPPRRWVVGTDNDGWIVEDDITIEYGPGGAGKSIQSAQMCRDISRGEPVFGLLPCRRMPTLFIGCEDDTAEMHRRFHKLGVRDTDDVTFACLGGQETVLHPPFRPGVELGEDTPTYSLITHQLASMAAGPKFLVLDNLAHLFHGNYFDPGNISTFLNGYLRRWVKQFNVAILLLAHPSENQRASGDGGYGGIGWSAGVRSRLYFEPHMRKLEKKSEKPQRIGDERVFSRKKSNYTREHREGEGLILDWQDWSFVPVERKAAPLFTPVTDAASVKRVSYAESDMIPAVQTAVEAVLAGNPSKRYTKTELSEAVSYHMGGTGTKRLEEATIRRHYLPKLLANHHPGYDKVSAKWRHITKH